MFDPNVLKKKVAVKIYCPVNKKHVNKLMSLGLSTHGWFSLTEKYCPYCLSMLRQDVNGREQNDN